MAALQDDNKLKVAVFGATGFTGSHTIKELLERGLSVTGLSRNPHQLGQHHLYTPIPIDITTVTTTQLASHFQGHDVIVNCFGPHSTHALAYSPFVEACRKILLAARQAKVGYVYQVGGTGSLRFKIEPGKGIPEDGIEYEQGFEGDTIDSNTWWRLYHETLSKNDAHCKYLDVILSPVGTLLKSYRQASLARESGLPLSDKDRALLAQFENLLDHKELLPVVHFVRACRVILMFYEGRKDFKWTFMSPPPNYFPCTSSGSYVKAKDNFAPTEADGKTMRGISALDLGIAIADEVENQVMVGQHWTLSADVPNDGVVAPTYWRIGT